MGNDRHREFQYMKGSPYFSRKPLIYKGMDVHLRCRINITAMPAVGSSLSKQTRFYPMINYRSMYGHLCSSAFTITPFGASTPGRCNLHRPSRQLRKERSSQADGPPIWASQLGIDFHWQGDKHSAVIYLERCLFGAPIGFDFDVDLDWAFLLVDWSGYTVNLTLGAPDLYPIRTAAKDK